MNTAPFHIAYGTAKAAVVAMTRTMAVELALDNIRVNAVAPGVTATAASRTYVDDDPDRDRTAIAMGRRGTPEEQAGAILFLLSDLSSYITGQTLLVDGGLNLKWTHLGADNTSLFLKDESFRSSHQEDAVTHTESDLDAAIEIDADPDDSTGEIAEELSAPMTIGVDAYISEEYARAERDKLWRKVWQQVGRVEEIPEVGSYLTYDILDDSIIVVRTGRATSFARTPQRVHAPRPPAGRHPRRRQERRAAGRASRSSADSTAGHTVWTAPAPTSASRTTGRAR